MRFASVTCTRCGVPRGEGAFCASCGVLGSDTRAGLFRAGATRRLTARLLDTLLFAGLAGIGWWLWLGSTAGEGQSPGKRLLGLRVVARDAATLPGATVWWREGVLSLLLLPLLPLNVLLALLSRDRPSIQDRLLGSAVVRVPQGIAAQVTPPQHERDRRARGERAWEPGLATPPGGMPPPPPTATPSHRTPREPTAPSRPPLEWPQPPRRPPERPTDRPLRDDRPMGWPDPEGRWEEPPPPGREPPRRPDRERRRERPASVDGIGPRITGDPRSAEARMQELWQRRARGEISVDDFEKERRRILHES